MLLFKSDINSLFEVSGLFQSCDATNDFLEKNPDSGVIHQFVAPRLIVACKIAPTKLSPTDPVTSIKLTDSNKEVNTNSIKQLFHSSSAAA